MNRVAPAVTWRCAHMCVCVCVVFLTLQLVVARRTAMRYFARQAERVQAGGVSVVVQTGMVVFHDDASATVFECPTQAVRHLSADHGRLAVVVQPQASSATPLPAVTAPSALLARPASTAGEVQEQLRAAAAAGFSLLVASGECGDGDGDGSDMAIVLLSQAQLRAAREALEAAASTASSSQERRVRIHLPLATQKQAIAEAVMHVTDLICALHDHKPIPDETLCAVYLDACGTARTVESQHPIPADAALSGTVTIAGAKHIHGKTGVSAVCGRGLQILIDVLVLVCERSSLAPAVLPAAWQQLGAAARG